MTQTDRIRQHLETYGNISSREAMEQYGVMRLASRISELKHQGMVLFTDRETTTNRYGEPTTYARYYLVEKGY